MIPVPHRSDRTRSTLPGWLILVAGTAILFGPNLFNWVWHWPAVQPAWWAWARAVAGVGFLFLSVVVESLLALWKFAHVFLAAFLAL